MKTITQLFFYILLSFCVTAQEYSDSILQHRQTQAANLKQSKKGPIQDEYIEELHYYPPTEKFKIKADVEFLMNEPTFRMPTSDGTSKEFKKYAKLTFQINERAYNLTVYENADKFQTKLQSSYLFLPFLDQTTGEHTYESGRYLDLKKQDITAGQVIIDFNKAYNPYCAYSDGYRCPQPPSENFLDLAIEAGEKKYTGPKNHKKQDIVMAKNFTQQEIDIIQSGDVKDKMYVLQTTVNSDSITLRMVSEDIKHNDPLLNKLLDRMLVTVKNPEQRGVGIAAPQVGINKNIIWVQRFDKEGEPFEYYINPKITWRSQLLRQGSEGCLSIPEQKEKVLRNYAIKLDYLDKKGNHISELVEGFTAVIFQHEIDHLYGILFTDRHAENSQKIYKSINENLDFFLQENNVLIP